MFSTGGIIGLIGVSWIIAVTFMAVAMVAGIVMGGALIYRHVSGDFDPPVKQLIRALEILPLAMEAQQIVTANVVSQVLQSQNIQTPAPVQQDQAQPQPPVSAPNASMVQTEIPEVS